MTDLIHVSSSGTPLAQTGIANAFATTNNLVNVTTGTVLATTPAGNGTVPQTTINTLADIIATCVNSTGAGSTPCTTLFSTALNGTTQPTDTVTAALNIAHNPGVAPQTFYAILGANPPFLPVAPFAPHDFMLDIQFSGGGVTSDFRGDRIVVDATGSVWKTNAENNGSLSKFNNLGVAVSPSTGYSFSNIGGSLAIDLSGNVWIQQAGVLTQVDGSTGHPIYSSPQTLQLYNLVAIDGSNNVWSASTSGAVKIDSTTHNSSVFSGGGIDSFDVAIAVSGNNAVWILGSTGTLSEFDVASGTPLSPTSGYADGQPSSSSTSLSWDMAIDGAGNFWITFTDSANIGTITKVNSNGNVLLTYGVSAPSRFPAGVAVDGAGSIWIGDYLYGVLRHLDGTSGAVIPTSTSYYQGTYTGVNSGKPANVAVDGSGNIWAIDLNDSINEFIGAATPVVTPIAAGVATNTLGTRP